MSITTCPFMPGMSAPSELFRLTRTGNIVTLDCTTASGSTFSTTPTNFRFGNASTLTVAVCAGLTLPMSVSFTNARILTLVRSAILRMVVPPLAEVVADVITVPTDTGRSMIVPFVGAVTVASSNRTFAIERFVRALTKEASAFAKATVAASISVAVMIFCV